MNTRKLYARLAGVAGAAAALFLVFQQPALIESARDRVFDQYQRLSPREHTATPVRVVEIDDDALAEYGQWPWPRHRFADMLDKLTAAGAAAVVFDVVFAEPDRTSPARVIESWLPSAGLSGLSEELRRLSGPDADHDARFAQALSDSPSVLHLTALSGASEGGCVAPLEASRVSGMRPEELAQVARSFRRVVPALPEFRAAAKGEGFARVGLTSDAIVRSAPVIALACDGTQIFPSLAMEALRVGASGLDPAFAPPEFASAAAEDACRLHVTGIANQSVSQAHLCRLRVPTTEDGSLWIHYSRPEAVAARGLTVRNVVEWDVDALAREVAGRIVMIGASAEGLRDTILTPLGDERPGVHVHADVIEQILAGETLFRAWDLMRPLEIFAAIVATALLIIFLPTVPAAAGFAIWAGMALALGAGSYLAFANARMLIDPVAPGMIFTFAFVGSFVVLFQQEQNARKFIRGAFGKFLSPLLIDRLEKDPDLLNLAGESREITAFFSDIRGFTTISEQLTPQQLTSLLNQYFTQMTRIILDHKGLVDKYIGDGLAAMWNAPIDVEDHAAQACRSALAMVKALDELNARWSREKVLPVSEIRIGIGLHTGVAQVGNFGSQDHLEYSMLGDMVNLTSRLESSTKEFRVPILISSDTYAQAADFAAVAMGSVVVKGRTEPTRIYALVGDERVASSAGFRAFKENFERGVEALEAGRMEEARAHLEAARKGPTFGIADAVDMYIETAAGAAQ
ncbi:MAG: adenylate/guanylate cyclase domain-containing protein [Parvularculaceae bacterium]